MIYADFDANGVIIAFYPADIVYPEGIPPEAVPITLDEWQAALLNPSNYKIVNGVFTQIA